MTADAYAAARKRIVAATHKARKEASSDGRYPGWVRLLILLGVPGVVWAGIAVWIARQLLH